MAVLDLTTKRLERLEKAQKETNVRLSRLEETMGQVASILELHSQQFDRMEQAIVGMAETMTEGFRRLTDRIDRLTTAIARGRTQDLVRLNDHERRIRALETREKPKRAKRT